METEIEKMSLESKDLVAERIEQVKTLFPEIVTEGEGSIDFEKLRLILGDEVDEGQERYAFTWPGKADAIRQAQIPSTATLRPDKESSVDWDTTENLYIEGDNLEVLKLLQRGYHGKVKMIYIDPPYNTGGEFVYEDCFEDSIEHYKTITKVEEHSNADTSGRYHSKWSSMMYSRLRLARELLKPEGIIAISIDDHEVSQLTALCKEIFGENNFEGHIHWRRRHNQPNDKTKLLGLVAEHIVVFAKDSEALKRKGVGKLDPTAAFSNPDNDPLGPWASKPWKVGSDQSGSRYIIKSPCGEIFDEAWMGDENTFREHLESGRIYFPRNGHGLPRKKYYQFEREEEGQCATNWWSHEQFGHNQSGNDRLTSLLGEKNVFSNPKPIELMMGLLKIGNVKADDLVLDFFSGSASLADAMMTLNSEDGVSRRYIMVQLPAKPKENSAAFKAGYSSLCEIAEERIRRAGKKIKAEIEEENKQLKIGEEPKKVPDIGFRVLKLDSSNFDKVEGGMLVESIVKADRTHEDIIFEMMVKWGLDLSLPMEETEVLGYPITSIAADELICCMDEGLTIEVLEAIAALEPKRVFSLDSVLTDTVKLNAAQIFKRASERAGIEIELRTV